ncbi:MAG: hypothetical protein U5N86_12750 [Planctomycetota bacterium]|nr:hypothetical protein [Planctomycetota bacterium]
MYSILVGNRPNSCSPDSGKERNEPQTRDPDTGRALGIQHSLGCQRKARVVEGARTRFQPPRLSKGWNREKIAGTVLLGGLRNIVIDITWMKAIKLEDNQEYYKLLAVYETIANLQPNVAIVWEFNSSNMAFNISAGALTRDEEERWVRRGIAHIREGIEKNPRTYRLYAHAAYIYRFKVAKADWLKTRFIEAGENPHLKALEYYRLAMEQDDARPIEQAQLVHTLVSLWRFDEAEREAKKLLRKWPDWISAGAVWQNRFEDYRYDGSVPYKRSMRIYKSWEDME